MILEQFKQSLTEMPHISVEDEKFFVDFRIELWEISEQDKQRVAKWILGNQKYIVVMNKSVIK